MIELKDLQLLAALARHQHFAKAAQDCGISQPAFSMRIRNMEDKLGVSIVRRANRFQGLTEEGQMILRRTRGILDDVKALEQEIAASRGEVSGILVLGVVPTAMAYAAQLVVQLLSSHPKILPRIESTTSLAIQRRLYDGTIDAGITYDDSLGRDMVTLQPLYDETYVLLAPEHMVADFEGNIRWAEAAELPLCLLDTQMQNRRILDRVFGDLGLKPRIVSEANGFMAAMVMARLGSAATIVPRALVDALGNLGGTRVLDLIDPVQARPICIATLDRTPELTTVRALKALVAGFSR
ncbi:LysR family transcriptional regulator [Parasedimentitalea psychrophila]|uniref:LysR family transcriptional regulator n=1 Tax=Parasedimentitalea psychrophila TaxID=2997337 RepID=A0A9Y2P270_9RHOB|nr:LysR family transcriptional regulator [Parasedimentitalea psychrophila]WIY26326.1 LysR family transcriptional regulator [Parasedimentitalea psychrophila]